MIIGFLGKGGSGKSTLSSGLVRFLEQSGKSVLAIDADHNMDLLYNLGIKDGQPFLGNALPDLKKMVGLFEADHWSKAFNLNPLPTFRLSPPDAFTEKYSLPHSGKLRVMAAGEHTNAVLYDKSCSHSLITPLKIYLPLLELSKNEYAVIDETAGLDSVGTGITTGFDVAVIVLEPTVHSIKTAKQILEMLKFYETPFIIVANKISTPKELDFVKSELGQEADAYFPFTKDPVSFKKMFLLLKEKKDKGRLEKTLAKIERNRKFDTEADTV